MASIQLRNFGGMAPSANPQNLPEAQATFVQNLDLRFGDFRPLATSANVVAATAGAALHRFESTGTFITRTVPVNFVRGPIPNDALERTYYSGDGAPKVVDNTNQVRQLGVPQPAAAPVVTPVVVDEFSEDDAKGWRLRLEAQVINTIRGNISTPFMGLSAADLGARFLPPGPAILGEATALLSIPGTLTNGAFLPTNRSHSNLNDMRLGYHLSTSGATTTARVELTVRGVGMQTNFGPDILKNILHPVTGAQLISDGVITGILDGVADLIAPANTNRDECIARMKPLLASFLALADSGDPGLAAARGDVEAYYAQSEIEGIIGAAVTNAVSSIIAILKGYTGGNEASLPITGKPGIPDYYFDPQ